MRPTSRTILRSNRFDLYSGIMAIVSVLFDDRFRLGFSRAPLVGLCPGRGNCGWWCVASRPAGRRGNFSKNGSD